MVQRNPNHPRGFTLIELVVVILILAVLATLVVPKVLDLGQQSRVATVKALAAAVKGAADSVYAACQMRMASCDVTSSLNVSFFDGTSPISTVYGRPRGGGSGSIHSQVSVNGFTPSFAVNGWYQTRWSVDGAPTPSACGVLYEDPLYRGPDLGYLVTIDTSGC